MIAGILKNESGEKVYAAPYFPVGTVYTSVTNVNPSKYFGGTWEAFAQGRTLVGVNTSDTDFNTVKKTGGNKIHNHTQGATGAASGNTGSTTLTVDQIPSHDHEFPDRMMVWDAGAYGSDAIQDGTWDSTLQFKPWGSRIGKTGGGKGHTHTLNSHTHTNPDTASSSSVQPYITVYFWVRTA